MGLTGLANSLCVHIVRFMILTMKFKHRMDSLHCCHSNAYRLFYTLLFFTGIGLVVGGTQYDPMVAFVCNKGAMHMDPKDGWYSDSRTDCLESKDNILNYCKTVYPSLEITNIVETSDLMTIKGWCPLGDKDCSAAETFKVRPYRYNNKFTNVFNVEICLTLALNGEQHDKNQAT